MARTPVAALHHSPRFGHHAASPSPRARRALHRHSPYGTPTQRRTPMSGATERTPNLGGLEFLPRRGMVFDDSPTVGARRDTAGSAPGSAQAPPRRNGGRSAAGSAAVAMAAAAPRDSSNSHAAAGSASWVSPAARMSLSLDGLVGHASPSPHTAREPTPLRLLKTPTVSAAAQAVAADSGRRSTTPPSARTMASTMSSVSAASATGSPPPAAFVSLFG